MENRYEMHLPEMVSGLQEFQKLSEIEGIILEEAAAAKDSLVKNQWIQTAERNGLLRLAKMIGFLGAEVMETELLRQEIFSRWNSRSPYTVFHLQEWLDGCLGEGTYTLTEDGEGYRLHLLLELQVKEKQDFLKKHLRKIVPANLILEVELHSNTYGDLRGLRHGDMLAAGLQHGQIPFEDLTVFRK